MRIYADVVMLLNFLVDFLLFLGTNRLSGFAPDYGRSVAAAMIGGAYAGACLIKGFSFLNNILWRVVCLFLMVMIAFGWNRSSFRRAGIFLLLSTALCGIIVGMGKSSIWMLLLSSALMWLLCNVSFHGSIGSCEYINVKLYWEGREMEIIALKDTGNTLHDPVTGEQVLVAGADVGERLIGLTSYQLIHPIETLASGKIPGLRLIPYHAVGQHRSMLLAVRIPKAQIGKKNLQPLVAFAPEKIACGEMYQMLAGGVI